MASAGNLSALVSLTSQEHAMGIGKRTAKASGKAWQQRQRDGTMPAPPMAKHQSKREPRSERDAWLHFRALIPSA